MRLADIACHLGGSLDDERLCSGYAIDTRNIKPGQIFLAFRGSRVDGHDYIAAAREAGAIAAIVEELQADPLVQIKVADIMQATISLARYYRSLWVNTKVVAITGSAGKTTTKEMLSHVCAAYKTTYATFKNQNNLLGLSLTLLNNIDMSAYVVLELGINAPGEMQELVELAQPDIALITNIGACHLEGLGNEETIAREKALIFSTLTKEGVAIYDADSPYKQIFAAAGVQAKQLTYSQQDTQAQVFLQHADAQADVCYRFSFVYAAEVLSFALSIPGRYQVFNALNTALVAMSLAVPVDVIQKQLRSFAGTKQRFEMMTLADGSLFIDDGYNANPYALRAVLSTVAEIKRQRKCLVFADMLELGEQSAQIHKRVGEQLSQYGITHLITFGDMAKLVYENANGMCAQHCSSIEDVVVALKNILGSEAVVLVKGSRGMHLQQVKNAIIDQVEV